MGDKSQKQKAQECYNQGELKEIFSPDNKWFTGQKLGRPPSDEELARHYISTGGAERFAKAHRKDFK